MSTATLKPQTEADKIVAAALADIGEVATLPEVTVKIIQIVENPRSTARDLHDVMKSDPALSARLLKVVNSAFYGLPGQIGSLDRAIVLLGLSAVKNIAIAASMTHMFSADGAIEGLSGTEILRHSLAVASACRELSAAQGRPIVEESFLAGLVHDIGMLVVRQAAPKKLAEVVRQFNETGGGFCELERKIVGADHAAFGMGLATKWRFPVSLCTAIGYHHKPMDLAPAHRELALLVHVADVIACRAALGFSATAANDEITPDALDQLKLDAAVIETVSARLPELVAQSESVFM